MSAGTFEKGKYESNAGDIYNCRVQPESKALTIGGTANSYPAGDADQKVSARMRSSQRKRGVNGRSVRVRLTATLTGYKADAILTVPVFQELVWNGWNIGDTGTYLATAVELVGKSGESIK